MTFIDAEIQIGEAFEPLLYPARHKAFYGGRGGAKSHSFAEVLVMRVAERKLKWLCCREVQKSIKESVHALLSKKILDRGLGDYYRILDTEIQHRDRSPAFLFEGLRTLGAGAGLKSLEDLDGAWVEEATRVSKDNLKTLTPTVRKAGSEVWFSWNPMLEVDAVDKMFRGDTPPPDSVIRQVSWRDNPWFPFTTMPAEMEDDRINRPGTYHHVWEGGYKVNWEDVFFDADALVSMREDVMSPIAEGCLIQAGNRVKFYPGVDPWLQVFESPRAGHDYVIGGDVSEALPKGDKHSAHVFRRGLVAEQVARFAPDCNEAELGRRMVLVANWYGQHGHTVPVAPESNSMGRATVIAIQETDYPDLFWYREQGTRNRTPRPGWHTNTSSRPVLLADFAAAVKEDCVIIHAQETLDQMCTFLRRENGKPEAAEGCQDDEVFGAAIAYQLIQRTQPGRTQVTLGTTEAPRQHAFGGAAAAEVPWDA